jgi:DNA-binding NarL/FixJ family response regulator
MKRETGENIISAIRQVLRGETYLSKALRSQTADSAARGRSPRQKSPIAALSHREFEIFRLIGLGNTNHDIARQLHLSLKTVEAHREHIKSKLSLSTSTALNLMAVRWETENAGA